MKLTILHFIICRSIHVAISLRPYSSVYLFHKHRHKNCMLTTNIIVWRLHWYFRALWTLLFISRVHNQMLMYTAESRELNSDWTNVTFEFTSGRSRLDFWVHQRASDRYSVYPRVLRVFCSTQEYKMHSCVISSEFLCVHKSTYWNVVNTRVHQQFYCVSCGSINNLIWIFSLHFDIRFEFQECL